MFHVRVYFEKGKKKQNNRNVDRQICPFERGHPLFDCPFSLQRKANRVAQLAAPVTDTRLLSFYPGHAFAIVFFFPGARPAGRRPQHRVRGSPAQNLINKYLLFYGHFSAPSYANAISPLGKLRRLRHLSLYGDLQTFKPSLFCLLGFEKSATGGRDNRLVSLFLCFATSSGDRGGGGALVFSRCGELICCDCSGRGAIVVNDCCSEQLGGGGGAGGVAITDGGFSPPAFPPPLFVSLLLLLLPLPPNLSSCRLRLPPPPIA